MQFKWYGVQPSFQWPCDPQWPITALHPSRDFHWLRGRHGIQSQSVGLALAETPVREHFLSFRSYCLSLRGYARVIKFHLFFFLVALGLCCYARALSSCSEQGLLSLWCVGFSLLWLLSWSTGARHAGSVVVACELSCSEA